MKLLISTVEERLNDRRFAASDNAHGRSGSDTVFHYHVAGEIITGAYQGGQIYTGHLIGHVTGADTIELLYHCLTTGGERLAGWSRGTVGVDQAGCTTLHFEWGWLSGASGGGESLYKEVAAE